MEKYHQELIKETRVEKKTCMRFCRSPYPEISDSKLSFKP